MSESPRTEMYLQELNGIESVWLRKEDYDSIEGELTAARREIEMLKIELTTKKTQLQIAETHYKEMEMFWKQEIETIREVIEND